MKNNIDYIYEYSDLNTLQTRAQVLTGEYKDVVVEFGGSVVTQINDVTSGKFTFEYTLYSLPKKLVGKNISQNEHFINFLSYLLINIINDRRNDPEEINKLNEAAMPTPAKSRILIDDHFYKNRER